MDYSKYFPIKEYYNRYIVPINPGRYRLTSDKMVCPVHDDHDPSLGIMYSKTEGETCHCFGCNFWGNIIELHKRVNKRIFKKYLSDDEAILDLCRIFDVDYNSIPKENAEEIKDKGLRQEVALDKAMEDFDIGDFKYYMQKGKKEKKPIGYFNSLVMTMLSSRKEEK